MVGEQTLPRLIPQGYPHFPFEISNHGRLKGSRNLPPMIPGKILMIIHFHGEFWGCPSHQMPRFPQQIRPYDQGFLTTMIPQ